MDGEVYFCVEGKAVPQGSYRGMLVGGKAIVMHSGGWRLVRWRADVRGQAMSALNGERFDGPVWMRLRFEFARPKSHRGAKGLRASAPKEHTQRPDVSKLVRSVEDALIGVAYHDDSQIVGYEAEKVWGDRDRVEVWLRGVRKCNGKTDSTS